jgi:hypothetical protein
MALDFTSSILGAGASSFMPSAAPAGASMLGSLAAPAAAAGGMGSLAGLAAGPWGMVAMSVLGGVQAAQAKRDARDVARVNQGNSLMSQAYNLALSDWQQQKNRLEKRSALENYKQFNTMGQIMPGYKDVYTPAALGDKPSTVDYTAHHRQKKNKVKLESQNKQAQSTMGTVTLPGG